MNAMPSPHKTIPKKLLQTIVGSTLPSKLAMKPLPDQLHLYSTLANTCTRVANGWHVRTKPLVPGANWDSIAGAMSFTPHLMRACALSLGQLHHTSHRQPVQVASERTLSGYPLSRRCEQNQQQDINKQTSNVQQCQPRCEGYDWSVTVKKTYPLAQAA